MHCYVLWKSPYFIFTLVTVTRFTGIIYGYHKDWQGVDFGYSLNRDYSVHSCNVLDVQDNLSHTCTVNTVLNLRLSTVKFREDLLKQDIAVHGTFLTWCLQWVSQSHITASPACSIQIDGVQSSVGLHLQSTWGKDILHQDPYKETCWMNLSGAANKQRLLNWCKNVWTCQKDLSIQCQRNSSGRWVSMVKQCRDREMSVSRILNRHIS